jgi:hypothetical protein
MRCNMTNHSKTTDDYSAQALAAFYQQQLMGTSKKIIIVEGPSDISWIKSACVRNMYDVRDVAGKDRVLEYAMSSDNEEHACFVIDLDLDYFKNTHQHENPKIVYNCKPLTDNLHFNDIEIFQFNSPVFDAIIYDVDKYKDENFIEEIRQKLEKASRAYGIFYVAYELLDIRLKKPSFLENFDPISSKYFKKRTLEFNRSTFESEVDHWLSTTHRNKFQFASQVIEKAHELDKKYPQPWIFSRGHTVVSIFTEYMMCNYPSQFNAEHKYAKDDIERLLRKIGPNDIKKLPLAKFIKLKE